MQWYWNHHVRGDRIALGAHYFSEPVCKARPQRLNLLEFQQQNRPHHRVFLRCKTTRPRKGIRFPGKRGRAAAAPTPDSIRAAAAHKPRIRCRARVQAMNGILRIANPAGAHRQPVADAASGRKEYTDDRITDLCEPARPCRNQPRTLRAELAPCYWMTFRLPRQHQSTLFYALIEEGMYVAVIELSRAR